MDNVIPMLIAAQAATATVSSVCLIHASEDVLLVETAAKAAVAAQKTTCATHVGLRIV